LAKPVKTDRLPSSRSSQPNLKRRSQVLPKSLEAICPVT
jgi:hypothetical protein